MRAPKELAEHRRPLVEPPGGHGFSAPPEPAEVRSAFRFEWHGELLAEGPFLAPRQMLGTAALVDLLDRHDERPTHVGSQKSTDWRLPFPPPAMGPWTRSPLTMPEISRESHYVPQATLRRWSHDGVNVNAYRLLVSHQWVPEWKPHAVRGLAKQRDLYTTFEGDQEGDDFEKFITREIEEPAQAAIEKVVANARMKPTDWHAIAKFVAAQQMRTPLFFLEWVKRLNEGMPETLQSILEEVGRKSPSQLATAERESDTGNYLREKLRVTVHPVQERGGAALVQVQVSSSRTLWLRFMRRMLTERIELFCNHRWRVMKLANDAEWPLTDHPVLALNYYGPGKYDFGAGWGSEGSEFILPVSPRIAVFTQVGRRDTGPWHATSAQTAELQRFVIERALRWIIARKPESWISTLRSRVVDAQAFAIEQESWRTWNAMHLDSEAEFNTPRVRPTTS